MAYELSVDMVDADGEISVTHSFWGMTEKETEDAMETHLKADAALSAAVDECRTIDNLEEIDDADLPEVEEDDEANEEGEEKT